ncbi:ABC transporter ATP-binding protein [Plantactinospora sp. GCM10030261]|uniref:ABC transporter ATP-binding protein n=1 Tax=Plantactinospora sp. GCM10030261 TaxID=3273420 RepID=UPI0036063D92
MKLDVDNVSVALGRRRVLDQVSLTVRPGHFTALIGPNGSGKSTLLRTIYRAQRPDSGSVRLDGRDLWRMPAVEAARHTGVLTQEQHSGFEFTVADTVAMGRTPHLGFLDRFTATDRSAVAEALHRTGLTDFAARRMGDLSGGERQRVLLARALAQQPRLLVLDEPTNHLDIRHQLELLALIRQQRLTVIAALHSLDIAAAYADTVVMLNAGLAISVGAPGEVLTTATIRDVFGVDATVHQDPDDPGRPWFRLRPRHVPSARP